MSGLMLVTGNKDFSEFKVWHVFPATPGAAAGVREGDVIAAVNGKPAKDFTLDQIITMLRQNGKTYHLAIRRAGRTLKIKLKTRRLV